MLFLRALWRQEGSELLYIIYLFKPETKVGPGLPHTCILSKHDMTWTCVRCVQIQAASVLFVDNPVGTGFSYTDSPDALTKDVAAVAADMLVLLKEFFSQKAEFQVNCGVQHWFFFQTRTLINSYRVIFCCAFFLLPTEHSLLYILWVLWWKNGSSHFTGAHQGNWFKIFSANWI